MGKAEAIVEDYLCKLVNGMGGIERKLGWINRAGAPDRFCAFRKRVCLVECKAEGEDLDGPQEREIPKLRKHGVLVFTIDSKRGADAVARWLAGDNLPLTDENGLVV